MTQNVNKNIKMGTKYDHQLVEKEWYAWWLENNFFEADPSVDAPTYTVLLPPPNVTGKLHLGHAWDATLQDIMTRQKRMQGYNVLYLPGMDHAGIATQAKVEEHLHEQGKTKEELGREAFIEESWKWKEEYAGHIRKQWAKLGLGMDYAKERFTLDADTCNVVRHVFVKMYEKGLIYKGKRMINWDPKSKTAISDIEVIYKEMQGHMYYFRYKLAGDDGYIEIATTRPETMFGDTAIAVNPDDARYKHLIGKKVLLPIIEREIPIIADAYCDPELGTGAVKITPAHDPNDFEIGERHSLEQITVINTDGTMNINAGPYAGLDRFACREKLVASLKAAEVCYDIKPHTHQVGHSERSGAIVEPSISIQWFVRMHDLAQEAIAKQKGDDKVTFIPERFEDTFLKWMSNIQDWCISRQLWWGHQIPAWTNKTTGELYVGATAPSNNPSEWVQDEDVLDTWFSSALWPFSALGWPDDNNNYFDKFYPTDTLVTAYDIIFFWVSRMIFQALSFTKQLPFQKVLIHGLARAADGRKMSKSLGNGVDPMVEIKRYGADALRFYLATASAPGNDLRYTAQKMESSWNFINKIWNASRFCLLHIGELQYTDINITEKQTLADQWILHQLNELIRKTTALTDNFEFGEVGKILTSFIWNEFCDWYIELAKPALSSDDNKLKKTTTSVLAYVLDHTLRLLHPFMPFVTEHIWQNIPHDGLSITTASWPKENASLTNLLAVTNMQAIMDIIRAVRNIRAEVNAPLRKKISLLIRGNNKMLKLVQDESAYLHYFCNLEKIKFLPITEVIPQKAITAVVNGAEIIVPLSELIDLNEEIERLKKEQQKWQAEIERLEARLNNDKFIKNADPQVIAEQKNKLINYQNKRKLVIKRIEELSS